jgi:hypothetical protein
MERSKMQPSTREKEQIRSLDSFKASRKSKFTTRVFHTPIDQASIADLAPLVPLRHLRATQLLKRLSPSSKAQLIDFGTSMTDSQVHLRYFLPNDLPQFDPNAHQWPLSRKVLRMRTTRLSEPRRRLAPEAAAIVTKGFPGKKVTRKPAIVGHLPEASKKRLVLALTGGARISLE